MMPGVAYGTVRWFGSDWGAPVCDPENHIPVPLGSRCERCKLWLVADDDGITVPLADPERPRRLAYHLECWLEAVGVRGVDYVEALAEARRHLDDDESGPRSVD